MKHVLLAGATGYLGLYIAKALKKSNYKVSIVVRDKKKFLAHHIGVDNIYEGDLSNPHFYEGTMEDVDIVISTLGITRQKDGQKYMDIDYGINHLLLNEAVKNGVEKFIYVSVLHGQKLKHLKICEAKERFVQELQSSKIESLIVRPSGFFSDIQEFFTMAQKGRVYLFGDGQKKLNPIDGEDLANVIVNAIPIAKETLEVGGPQSFTHNQIAYLAYEVLGKEQKVTYIPNVIRKTLLSLVRIFTNEQTYGPVEFFLTVMDMDMACEKFGNKKLIDYFNTLKANNS